MKIDRMGVAILMAHLIITLAMIGAYVFFTYLGKGTTTIENMLLIAIGFWFSAMGKPTIPSNNTSVQHANEVKVMPQNPTEGVNKIE